MLRPINLRSVSLIIVLGFGVVCQALSQTPSLAATAHDSADSPAPDHAAAAVYNHSVKLSWGPSTPASKLPRDAVIGYNVYRSTTAHDRNPKRINSKLYAGTTYTDTEVEAGKTYFYVTRGVTAQGVESGPSNQAKVVMPPR